MTKRDRRCVAWLRAINVGGHNKVPMRELAALFGSLGHRDVATYINSGNVVFTASGTEAKLVAALEAAIRNTFGFGVPVIVRDQAELAAVAAGHPHFGDGSDLERLAVVFLEAAPTKAAIASIDPSRSPADAFSVIGRELFIRYGAGAAASKLTLDYLEKKLGTRATARNWNTVNRLLAMMTEPPRAIRNGSPR